MIVHKASIHKASEVFLGSLFSSKTLEAEGFIDIDPSHPAGGSDGGKDFLCCFNGNQWIAAVYFPRGAKTFSEVKK